MSLKMKLISTIGAFILVASMFIMGVLAAQNIMLNIGGSISFKATDVQATISEGELSGGTLANAASKMQEITFDAENDGTAELATWTDLQLQFNQKGEDLTITFTITNNHTEQALNADISNTFVGTFDNATMKIEVFENAAVSDSPTASITYTSTGTTDDAISTSLNAKTEGSASYATYRVTFHIVNANKSASISNFNIPITLSLAQNGYTVTLNYENASGWQGDTYFAINNGEENNFWEAAGDTPTNEDVSLVLYNVSTIEIWRAGAIRSQSSIMPFALARDYPQFTIYEQEYILSSSISTGVIEITSDITIDFTTAGAPEIVA